MKVVLFVVSLLLSFGQGASAHYHMLIPDKHSVKTGDEVTIVYQFGHPFEHQLFDAAEPASATIFSHAGEPVDVKAKLKKIEIAGEGKKVVAYQLTFKPEKRGDHLIVFTSPAVTLAGEKNPIFDTVKVVLHVQTEGGWDSTAAHGADQRADLVPLTRPYGLRPGMLFRATYSDLSKQKDPDSNFVLLGFEKVEIERYNPEPPKELPPEEHTTYTARTDAIGVLATTLPDAGWWAITAIKPTPKAIHRCTFWVPVDGKIPLKLAD